MVRFLRSSLFSRDHEGHYRLSSYHAALRWFSWKTIVVLPTKTIFTHRCKWFLLRHRWRSHLGYLGNNFIALTWIGRVISTDYVKPCIHVFLLFSSFFFSFCFIERCCNVFASFIKTLLSFFIPLYQNFQNPFLQWTSCIRDFGCSSIFIYKSK